MPPITVSTYTVVIVGIGVGGGSPVVAAAGAPGTAGSSRTSRRARGVTRVEVDEPDGSSEEFGTSSCEATIWRRRKRESVLSSIVEDLLALSKKKVSDTPIALKLER